MAYLNGQKSRHARQRLAALVEAIQQGIESAGLRFDLAAALLGGMTSYFRLLETLADFLSQVLPRSSYTVADLYLAAFGRHAQEVLLYLGVASGAALAFAATRIAATAFNVCFPEAVKQARIPHQGAANPSSRLLYQLPPFPPQAERPQFVVGEEHAPDGTFIYTPRWHVIPQKGLVGGLLAVGAPGSAKTAAVIKPFIEQIVEFGAHDPATRVSLFAVDRKGSLAKTISKIAARHGRSVTVLRLGGPKFNLLSSTLPAAAVANALVAAYALRGQNSHDEPEWIKSGINRIFHHAIGLFRLAYGEVTLKDLAQLLSGPLRADAPPDDPNAIPEELSQELKRFYRAFQDRLTEANLSEANLSEAQRAELEAEFAFHANYFEQQFVRMNSRNKATLIDAALDLVELFAAPDLAETFCSKQTEFGGIGPLMESGEIVVFSPDERLGRAAITAAIILKLDFQRSALNRLRQAEMTGVPPTRLWAFVADEYQAFATVGDEGDDAFFALSREALITNVLATQSLAGLQAKMGEARLRTLLGAIRTKLFLTLADPNDSQLASRLAGESYRPVQSTSFSESNKNARLNPLTDALEASSSTVSEQRSYSEQLRPDFLPIAFSRLNTCEAIICSFNGERQRVVKIYLKPDYLPRELPHNQAPHYTETQS